MPRILVVEDDPANCEMIARRLMLEGYEIMTAGDGVRALGIARREHPDLILMDMALPVLNGWQATQRLKADAETRHIPIIALTAYAMSDERQRSFEVGSDDYEAKPINFEQLCVKIERLLRQQATGNGQQATDGTDS